MSLFGFGGRPKEEPFINQQESEEKMETIEVNEAKKTEITKEAAQKELMEKFGLIKTSDFQSALQQGKTELAEEWLNYIVENKENFPQYASSWESWLKDRRSDIELYKSLKNGGSLEKIEHRTKEEAQTDLRERFGFPDTNGFRNALKNNDIETAEKWLDYIMENKMSFPQYLANWDNWLSDRQRELAEAKK